MSFEIQEASGTARQLRHCKVEDAVAENIVLRQHRGFADLMGVDYWGAFDGRNVIFKDGDTKYTGRWVQGTAATLVAGDERLLPGFQFTFMDHGRLPQRLHAQWTFDGPELEAIRAWLEAGFAISKMDRYLNRKHAATSTHLRTQGNSVSGADSSHAIVYTKAGTFACGEIHVGEFNPMTGYGIGFLLHQMERWR